MTEPPDYELIAYDALARAGVPEVLSGRGAIVLERIAFGAGATRWYSCATLHDLRRVASLLSPSSCLTFYFGGQLKRSVDRDDARSTLRSIIAAEGDAVLGYLVEDGGVAIHAVTVESDLDLEAELGDIPLGRMIVHGAFPGRDSDGTLAITLDLPDSDGEVRRHPH